MRVARFILLVCLLVSSAILVPAKAEAKVKISVEGSHSKVADRGNDDATIELNPDFVEDEYDDQEETEKDAKSKINKALDGSKRGRSKKMMKFLKKHRLKITVAMVLIAFHREIGSYLLDVVRPKVYDAATQTSSRRWVRLDPTKIIKLLVFLDVMRQVQSAGRKQDTMVLPILLMATKNPFLSTLISKALLQENYSYVPPVEQHYTFERLNDRYQRDCWALQKAANVKALQGLSLTSLAHLREPHQEAPYSGTVIVLDLSNINRTPGRMDTLRDEVSFLLHQHRSKTIPYALGTGSGTTATEEFELLVLLESPGGSAADFALASEQLLRLRKEPGIRVTVCVDKVAASGGYMIACASSPGRLFAAPFAVLGSIGVVGQTLNLQRALESWGVRPMVFKAGKDKAPVGLIGEVKPSDIKSIQTMVDETHAAFKRHVVAARPTLTDSIERLATGKVWMGYDALDVGLIDRIVTSDEYISERIQDGAKILKLMNYYRKRSFFHYSPRGGIEGQFQSVLLDPIKELMMKAWTSLVGQKHLPELANNQSEPVPLVMD